MFAAPKANRLLVILLAALIGSNLLFDHLFPAFAWTLAFALVVLTLGISRVAGKLPGVSIILLGGVLIAFGIAEWAGLHIPTVVRLLTAVLWFLAHRFIDRTGR